MKAKILFLFLFIISFYSVVGQENQIILGALVKNMTGTEINETNPYVVMTLFKKNKETWKEYDPSEFNPEKINFIISSKNKSYGSIKTQFDTSIDRFAYYVSSFKILSDKLPLNIFNQFTLPGFPSDSMFNNSILSNQNFYLQRNRIKNRRGFKNDSLIIYKYLKSEAKVSKLGEISNNIDDVIGLIYNVYNLSNGDYLIEADIKLNMYCYSEKVPFVKDSIYSWNSTEKFSLSSRSLTPRAFFAVKKGSVKYLDYNLNLVTSGDYDNDGYDELIFNFAKYNKDGYLLLTTRNNEIVISAWSYH